MTRGIDKIIQYLVEGQKVDRSYLIKINSKKRS